MDLKAAQAATSHDPNRRFRAAIEQAQADWSAADPVVAAALSGCSVKIGADNEGPFIVSVPLFGRTYEITHPGGEVVSSATGKPAHVAISILLLHYLVAADGAKPADRWIAFRELPDGLFYAQAFAAHAETVLALEFGADLPRFVRAAGALKGTALDLADVSFRFLALPNMPMAVLVWKGDDEFPARARVLFDANAGRCLPTEDLSGLGDWLAHQLVRQKGRSE